ncbi:YihY/virulence factor BrkB family protein [Amycolatopsis thermoflava]
MEVRPRRFWETTRRIAAEIRDDNVPTSAAAIAFFGLLALAPALIALLTIYSLVTDPQTVRDQLAPLAAALPGPPRDIVTGQLADATALGSRGLTFGLAASVAGLLWTTSTAMRSLIGGLTRAFDETETRGFLHVRLLALALTLGAIAVAAVALAAITVFPLLLEILHVPAEGRWLVNTVRWAGLVVLLGCAIAVLYRFGPDRAARRRWFSPGVLVALAIWLAGSAGFTVYVEWFGHYHAIYGTLAGLAVLMLWLYLASFAVLVGAEVDAELHRSSAVHSAQTEELPVPPESRRRRTVEHRRAPHVAAGGRPCAGGGAAAARGR